MTPTQHPTNTRVIGAPAGWTVADPSDPNYVAPLRVTDTVQDGMACMQSVWKPDANELQHLNKGGAVALTVWGTVHPVVSVGVVAKW